MHLLKDILTYAYRGSGKYVLAVCIGLSVIASLAQLAPFLGGIASLRIGAYFCAIFFQLIRSTAIGGKEAPEFPETSNLLDDIILPMLQVLAVSAVSFGPALLYVMLAPVSPYKETIFLGLAGTGVIYFPMAMLSVVVLGYIGALSPHIVLPAILRAGWLYWIAVILLAAVYTAEVILGNLLKGQIILGPLVMAVVTSYTLMTNARTLGVIYREKQEELNWL
jgi:hypothetical protein